MDIPQDLINTVAREEMNVGDVYEVRLGRANGITPQGDYETRRKFFIVLGFDDEGNVYGGVVVNSRLNSRLPLQIRDYHLPIACSKYTFLRYDSFVNCPVLMVTTPQTLLQGYKIGVIQQEDIELIIGAIRESPNETKARLRQFGLL